MIGGVDTIVQGNLIGTDASGTESIPNTANGILIGAEGALIGGLDPGARNVVSGNSGDGIAIDAASASIVQGNLIGPDISGTKTPGSSNVPGNGTNGLSVCGPRNLIGGTDPRARNIISGNGGAGISLCNFSASENRIEGNFIGVDVNRAALGNRLSGVACCLVGSVENVVGGTEPGTGNVIAHNGDFGVQVSNTASDTDQNAAAVLGNSIYANGLLGIDLGHPAPGNLATANDPLDADTGPNGQQNYPVLDWTSTGNPTTVTGTLHSKPNATYRVEFFHNDVCDTFPNGFPNGGRFGEGETFLGAIEVSTNASGNATIPATVYAVSTDVTDVITATATDENGSTSEFSECRADLEITKSDDPDPVTTGQTLTYTIDIANQGPAPALEVVVVDQLPTILDFALDAITPSQGSCALTDPFTDRYICSLGLIPRFGAASITITGTVVASAPTSITNTASVSSELNDPDPDDNRATAETQVVEDQPTGTIVVRKVTLPSSSPQTFSFSASYDADGFSLGNGQSNTSSGLTPGEHSVSEPPVAGWDTTSSCDDGSAPNAIQLAADETVTCTFTNTQRATIIVEKMMIGATDTFTFIGTPSGAVSANNATIEAVVQPGTYQSVEAASTGWDLMNIVCDDLNSTGNVGTATASFNAEPGETVTCTFTNTKRGSATVLKTTNGVVDPAKDIKFVLGGQGLPTGGLTRTTSGDLDGLLEWPNLAPGQYTVCETPVPAGFTSFWKLDGVIVTPYNPDASRIPPEDLGTRCYNFSVSPGQRLAFGVDNSRPGGDPRTIGYWKNWNRCTGGNQSATAAKNGGAAAGFFLVEDLLPQGIGDFSLTSCQQALKLLAKQDQSGRGKSSDAAYELGAQLLAARFNLAAGAETCSSAQQAALNGQTLLDGLNFTGSGDYLGSKSKDPRRPQALTFAATLDRYNNGNLC